jgi:hypothetical protein
MVKLATLIQKKNLNVFIMVNKKDWHLIDTVVEKHDLAEG